jgi:hypothetical protein
MRVLIQNYGDVRIFTDRPFGYKRYIVDWGDRTEIFSSLWYGEQKVIGHVERILNRGEKLG